MCFGKCVVPIYEFDCLDNLGHGSSIDFISHHTYLLMGILGAMLAIVIGLLSLLLCHCG